MADEYLVVAGYHDGYELYKKVIRRPETHAELLHIVNDFAEQTTTVQNLFKQNPQSQLILNKLQQRFKHKETDQFVDLPSPEIICNEMFKPEYNAHFVFGVREQICINAI